MCKPQCQSHDMVLVVILNDSSNIQKNFDSSISYSLRSIIQELIQHLEDLFGSHLLLRLGALLLNELDQGDELVEQGYFDVAAFSGEDVE